jgi:hypothetical protein
VISADVVEPPSATTTGYGCTAILDPSGGVVERVPELATGRIRAVINPVEQFRDAQPLSPDR